MISTPIIFLVYNRLSETKEAFLPIKQIKPQSLYVVADGPKNKADQIKTNAVVDFLKIPLIGHAISNGISPRKTWGSQIVYQVGYRGLLIIVIVPSYLRMTVLPTLLSLNFVEKCWRNIEMKKI